MPVLASSFALITALAAASAPNAAKAGAAKANATAPAAAPISPTVVVPNAAQAVSVAGLSSRAALAHRLGVAEDLLRAPTTLSIARASANGAELWGECPLWVQPAANRMTFADLSASPVCVERWGLWLSFRAAAGQRYAVECGTSRGGWIQIVRDAEDPSRERTRSDQADTDRPTIVVEAGDDRTVLVHLRPAIGVGLPVGHVGRCQIAPLG